jgi:Uma2 family endonuclease
MITAPAKPITAEEFAKFDPEWRYDLIRGELRRMPPQPGEEHGAITSDLSLELSLYVRDNELGQCYAAETRFIIARDPDTAIGPDWAFVAADRLPQKRGRKLKGARRCRNYPVPEAPLLLRMSSRHPNC